MKQQDARSDILARIRSGKPQAIPLPDVPLYPYAGNPREDFISHLLSFDGRAIEFKSRAEALEWLRRQHETDLAANTVYSAVGDLEGNMAEDRLADLHNAHLIDTCVAESSLGVAETGSVWVTEADLRHAACALLSRHLFILLDSSLIVGGIHDAYAALRLAESRYGSFFTGPSATADIEAVHITGAQGPPSLTVLLYNCPEAPDTPQLRVNPDADTSVWLK